MYDRVIVIDVIQKCLGELVQVRSGYPFRGPIQEVRAGGTLVAQMKDVDPAAGLNWAGAVRAELRGRRSPDWLGAGDILFVPRGSRFFAVSVDSPPMPAVCGPHLFHLRVRPRAGLLPAFLTWQINQAPLQRQLRSAAEGSSQLSIRIGEIEALKLAIPSMAQQARIVTLAEAAVREHQLLMRLAENREQELAALANTLADAAGLRTH